MSTLFKTDIAATSIIQINLTKATVQNVFENINDIFKLYPTFNIEEIEKCLKFQNPSIYSFSWIYSQDYDKINIKTFCKERKNNRFFYKEFPELLKEVSKNNHGLEIEKISFSNHSKINWSCLKDSSHEDYLASFNNRTRPLNPSACPGCKFDSLRKFDKTEKQNHIDNYISGLVNKIIIGDSAEIYIFNLLEKSQAFQYIEKTGQTNEKCDIKITLKTGEIKSLQIKTLTKLKKNTYYMTNNVKYQNNILIAMVSNDRLFFALEFSKNITVKNLSLPFDNTQSKYKDLMFKNVDQFVTKLIELIPRSCNYELLLSLNQSKEFKMFERLNEFCKNKNLIFEINNTNSDAVDFYINGIPIQGKYCSTNCNDKLTYNVSMTKSFGKLKGRIIRVPYNIDDGFEYVVVEVGRFREITNGKKSENIKEDEDQKFEKNESQNIEDNDEDQNFENIKEDENIEDNNMIYHSNFCIIPKSELISQKILTVGDRKGKKAMYICPPDYNRDHWSKKYWYNKDSDINIF